MFFRLLFVAMTLSCSGFAEVLKEELFAHPELISCKVSPDGNWIAYVGADSQGISNVFISPKNGSKEQITCFKTPEIIRFFWSGDSKRVLLLRDEKGAGQLHLHGVDVQSKAHVNYTEKFSKANAKVVHIGPSRVVVGLNLRNPQFHDLYRLDLDSGQFELLFENGVYAKFLVSDGLNVILKMRINEDGSWTVLTADDKVFMQLSGSDAFQTEFLSYNEKKGLVYLLDNRFSNTNRLIAKSLNGEEKILGAQADSDVDEVLFLGEEPKAYASYVVHKKWHAVDPAVKEDLEFLEKKLSSDFEVINSNMQGDLWIVSNSIPDQGDQICLYDKKEKNLIPLSKPSDKVFAKSYPMVIHSRDGQTLVCYYLLPPEHDKGGFVEKPIPLVVMPHGGPFKVRDKYQFCPYHQWLAACGYAVLSVNFRLSSGFGKDFVNAGNGEWGGKAHLDVLDGVEACISRGIAQRGKIGVFGGSYGGYETLVCLTQDPESFACCVGICAPSNLKTLLDNVPPFWEFTSAPLSDKMMFFTKKAFMTSMGEDLEKCSPLNHLEGIKAPLLLVQGKNDPIVTEIEADQIYQSMKQNGKEVTYILFPDEGHRFARFANKMLYLDHAEQFLAKHLGGKYRPVHPEILANSSGQISK